MKQDEHMRKKLADIARTEALKEYKGNTFKGGELIEKYLADFREGFIKIGNREQDWHNKELGFDWCAAFVCWCAKEAGFELPIIKPIPIGGSLASVPIWYHYAKNDAGHYFYERDDDSFCPDVGDLVLYNDVFSGKDLDHIGVVIEVYDDYLITAEGNEGNSTKLLRRVRDHHINGYVRLMG